MGPVAVSRVSSSVPSPVSTVSSPSLTPTVTGSLNSPTPAAAVAALQPVVGPQSSVTVVPGAPPYATACRPALVHPIPRPAAGGARDVDAHPVPSSTKW